MTSPERTCWFLDDAERHPETECPESAEWFQVATDGREKWINCPTCEKTWFVSKENK